MTEITADEYEAVELARTWTDREAKPVVRELEHTNTYTGSPSGREDEGDGCLQAGNPRTLGRAAVSTWPARGWTEPWAVKRRPTADAAFIGPGDFTRTLRRSMRQLQNRPGLIEAASPRPA
ncbi:hypothetical protein ACWECC_38955 [Streptomyces microflavus]